MLTVGVGGFTVNIFSCICGGLTGIQFFGQKVWAYVGLYLYPLTPPENRGIIKGLTSGRTSGKLYRHIFISCSNAVQMYF